MIAVDTSALMAIVLLERDAAACAHQLAVAAELMISAGTLAETMIVAGLRGVGAEMAHLLGDLEFQVVPVTAASARRSAEAYSRWGKGVHPAGLNYGDCFAYEVAQSHACPLLFIGDDFLKTDVQRVV